MDRPSDQELAKRSHPVPAEALLDAMRAIVQEGKEAEFLAHFGSAFVLASVDDIGSLKTFLANHVKDLRALNIANSPRC